MRIEDIKNAVIEHISGTDTELVGITISEDNVIDVEVDSIKGVTIDECVSISRHIETKFDREQEDYELTVASASISEPFKLVLQYKKNVGRDVELKLTDGTIITAILKDADDDSFKVAYEERIAVEGKKRKELKSFERTITYGEVSYCKLVFNF